MKMEGLETRRTTSRVAIVVLMGFRLIRGIIGIRVGVVQMSRMFQEITVRIPRLATPHSKTSSIALKERE